MKQQNKRKEREEEVQVWLPRDTGKQNYVRKHKQRDKGLEVVFDPKHHK